MALFANDTITLAPGEKFVLDGIYGAGSLNITISGLGITVLEADHFSGGSLIIEHPGFNTDGTTRTATIEFVDAILISGFRLPI